MKNLHLLPTEKPSILGRFIDTNNLFLRASNDIPRGENVNIYITSDEEIKEGDVAKIPCGVGKVKELTWKFGNDNPSYIVEDIFIYKLRYGQKEGELQINSFRYEDVKKIILTTDHDLIKDGVQAIDDEFLEWFVKNPSCEFVMTIPDVIGLRDVFQPTGKDLYKIIIPKEEEFELVSIGEETVKLVIPMIQDKEEIKQETLEEAVKREYNARKFNSDYPFNPQSFILGAKWQQEQEQNNENSWFNQYQEVEDYIIKRIGDKFLDATPEKYNTASEATIALLEDNWEQDKNVYTEEQVKMLMFDFYYDMSHKMNVPKNLISENATNVDEWFKQHKKK